MWQIYAMMARDQIDEEHQRAARRRRDAAASAPRRRHRIHLPALVRHPVRPSARTR